MKRINFKEISRFKPRKFVGQTANLEDLDVVKSLCDNLLMRDVCCREDFSVWFENLSEFEIALDEVGSVLYIEMTCQTDNEEFSSKYKSFVEKIVPVVKDYEDKLNKKYLELAGQFAKEEESLRIYQRDIQSDIEIFVKDNIDLETKIQLLSQQYQEVIGQMTVDWEGAEKTLVALSKYLLDPDRALRHKVWDAMGTRRLKDKDKIDAIFDEMLSLRHSIAQNANFSSFADYKFKEMHRFDYTIEKCKTYHDAVESCVVPLWSKILERRKQKMKLDTLKPWDTAVDPLGRAALHPFENTQELVSGCKQILSLIDPECSSLFAVMEDGGYLDLENRKGKAPGGYQSNLSEARKPFIFMNAVGTDSDVKTLLHESGHAVHSFLCADQPILHYLHAPMEFCEVASMTMEMLSLDHLSVFYQNAIDARRSAVNHLEDVIFILVWVATVDAFQHWIYAHPGQSREERARAWLSIRKRFGGDCVDWNGYDEVHRSLWHKQLHIFEVPFYYIEYGIAQLGALQIWLNSKKQYNQAIRNYKEALSLGGSQTLPVLFDAAGIKFDFSEGIIVPLMKEVESELQTLWS